jgi:cysteine desulfurase family protein
MKKVYVDNSSTSYPKAPGVSDVIKEYIDNVGCNVNRGGYKASFDVGLEILKARQLISDMFHTGNPQEVVFTPSVTYSLNMLLHGFLKKGDHIITTSMEHNSVMRPLHALSQRGITYDMAFCNNEGSLDIDSIISLIRNETKAVVMLHASNVCGTVMPIDEVAKICHKNGLKLIIDTAQTAGILDIDANKLDALAFTGHKGLLGVQGIGGFIIKKEFAKEITPIIVGGTGSQSDRFEQPEMLPDKFEPGTMNIPAILGLKKAIEFIQTVGIKEIYKKEMELTATFLSMAQEIEGVRIIGKKDISDRVAVVSLDFPDSDNAAVAALLDEKYNIMTRCGLHCAPSAHKTLHTYPHGTVRFSFGYFNTMDDVEYVVQAIEEVLKEM